MNRRQLTWSSVITLSLLACAIGVAQDHDRDRDRDLWHRHPNLAQAERLTHQADQYLDAAQQANRWDGRSHAARAEELLRQADREIWEAARESDRERH